MFNCPNCNKSLPADSEFCPYCGSKLTVAQNAEEPKKKKGIKAWQIVLIVLSVLLVLGIGVGAAYYFLTADSVTEDTDVVVETESEEESTTEETTTEDEAITQVVVDKTGELVIGFSGPLTGPAWYYGTAVNNGIQLAVDEINANGGIDGMTIKLISADDMADTAVDAANAYNSLKNQGMQIFIGPVTSGSALAVKGLTYYDNMFQLTPTASADDVIENNNCFQICYSDSDQGTRAAEYIDEQNLATKVGIIYNSADEYSTGIYNSFKSAAAGKNFSIVAEMSFTYDNCFDFTAQIQACKSAGADLVFLPIYYSEASLILKQSDEVNYNPQFFGCDGLDGILNAYNFDASLAEGLMMLAPFCEDDTDYAIQNFVDAYYLEYNQNPDMFAAAGYDAVYAIKAAAEKGDINPQMTASEICEKMKSAMTQVTIDGITGNDMTWSATGEVNKTPKAVKIQNGTYVSAD